MNYESSREPAAYSAGHAGPLSPQAVVKLAFLVARRLVDAEAARDVAQDTWIKYRRQLAKEGREWQPARARGWVRCVAGNAARSLLRRIRPVDGLLPEPLDASADPAGLVAQAEDLRQRHAEAERILAGLPEAKRNLIVLRDLEGRSWRSIAAALGENERTLRSRYSRLKAELRARLPQTCDEVTGE